MKTRQETQAHTQNARHRGSHPPRLLCGAGTRAQGKVLVWHAQGHRVVVVISLKEKELILKRYQAEWSIACV